MAHEAISGPEGCYEIPKARKKMSDLTQTIEFASGDVLWTQFGVPWTSETLWNSIAGLLQSPSKFIEAYRIKVTYTNDKGVVVTTPPVVRSPFTVEFKDVADSDFEPTSVDGIHNTSSICVRPDITGSAGFLPMGSIDLNSDSKEGEQSVSMLTGFTPSTIPGTSKILVTLGPMNSSNKGRAYLHWEISPTGPTIPTKPFELANHVLTSLEAPQTIIDEYNRRLSDPRGFTQVRFVDSGGNEVSSPVRTTGIEVYYDDSRNLTCEAQDTALRGNTPVVSCNSDLGNYYVDDQGVIHIVVDSTTVKMY